MSEVCHEFRKILRIQEEDWREREKVEDRGKLEGNAGDLHH